MIQKPFCSRSIIVLCLMINAACGPAIIAGGAAVGVGSAAFIHGELKTEEKVSFDAAWKAAQKSLEDLGFTTTSKENGEFWGDLIARNADGQKVRVKLRSPEETRTEIRIRVGFFGDETASRRILDDIRRRY